jgi:ABC-type protease/lipase transport system fused ATPase/permease subunit
VPQEPVIFAASVLDNVRYGRPQASRDEALAACQRAFAMEFIERLPQGIDTLLGERGVTLSGGQRQRIGLARALFGEPRLVVLDEPNANLDAAGEQALIAALRRLRQQRATVLLVTQRMSLLSEADRVLMLRAGSIEAIKPAPEVIGEMTAVAAAAKAAIPAAAAPQVTDPLRTGRWVMRGPRLGAEAGATAAERKEP